MVLHVRPSLASPDSQTIPVLACLVDADLIPKDSDKHFDVEECYVHKVMDGCPTDAKNEALTISGKVSLFAFALRWLIRGCD